MARRGHSVVIVEKSERLRRRQTTRCLSHRQRQVRRVRHSPSRDEDSPEFCVILEEGISYSPEGKYPKVVRYPFHVMRLSLVPAAAVHARRVGGSAVRVLHRVLQSSLSRRKDQWSGRQARGRREDVSSQTGGGRLGDQRGRPDGAAAGRTESRTSRSLRTRSSTWSCGTSPGWIRTSPGRSTPKAGRSTRPGWLPPSTNEAPSSESAQPAPTITPKRSSRSLPTRSPCHRIRWTRSSVVSPPIDDHRTRWLETVFLCLGDSACLTKPFSGEGVTSGWTACKIAVDVVDQALQEED